MPNPRIFQIFLIVAIDAMLISSCFVKLVGGPFECSIIIIISDERSLLKQACGVLFNFVEELKTINHYEQWISKQF